MKKVVYIFCIINLVKIHSQNLVPNPSFEQFSACPQGPGQISLLAGNWQTIYSSDFFSSCATGSFGYQVDVPINKNGFQYPKDGNGYTGFVVYQVGGASNDFREWLEVKLIDTLLPSKNYCVSYYVNLSDSSHFAISNIQALFSDTMITHLIDYNPNAFFYYYPANINNPSGSIISDTTSWVKIEGLYSPNNKKPWMLLGNFETYSQIDTVSLSYNPNYPFSYYYIDLVSVTEIKPVNTRNDTTVSNCDSIVLGANYDDNASYSWWPNLYMDDSTLANPVAVPHVTTTYHVRKIQCGTITYDSIKVTVQGCNIGIAHGGQQKNSLKIVPNPNNGSFNIDISGGENLELEIYNAYGQLVLARQYVINDNGSIKIEGLADGVYMVKLIVDGIQNKSQRIIVTK